MKDLVISVRRQKTEIKVYLICLLIAIGLNICSILRFKAPWTELYTKFLYVLVISLVIYVLSLIIRGIIYMMFGFF